MKIKSILNKSALILLLLVLANCSEGDIIDISIDFDGQLLNCSNANDKTFVFYKIDDEINRSLSGGFSSTTFDIAPETVDDISTTTPIEITLNTSTNQVIYREFDVSISGEEYFCSSIPPSTINVNKELVSSSGTIEVSYQATTDPTIFTRTVTLRNVTFVGNEIAIRKEVLILGSDEIILN